MNLLSIAFKRANQIWCCQFSPVAAARGFLLVQGETLAAYHRAKVPRSVQLNSGQRVWGVNISAEESAFTSCKIATFFYKTAITEQSMLIGSLPLPVYLLLSAASTNYFLVMSQQRGR